MMAAPPSVRPGFIILRKLLQIAADNKTVQDKGCVTSLVSQSTERGEENHEVWCNDVTHWDFYIRSTQEDKNTDLRFGCYSRIPKLGYTEKGLRV
jgi:hypothetical protein